MTTTTIDDQIRDLRNAAAVVRVDGHYRVLATRCVGAGETIFRLEGIVVDTPTRFSVQIGPSEHLAPPAGEDVEETMDRRPWRFLNHSCEPNARIEGRELIAVREIVPWEQVTFDYNTTELLLASPFNCQCGAAECVKTVRGFLALDAGQRAQREATLAPHLREFTEEG